MSWIRKAADFVATVGLLYLCNESGWIKYFASMIGSFSLKAILHVDHSQPSFQKVGVASIVKWIPVGNE